jgi:CheY-like chemotaxis protein
MLATDVMKFYRSRVILCQRAVRARAAVSKSRLRALSERFTAAEAAVDTARRELYVARLRALRSFDMVLLDATIEQLAGIKAAQLQLQQQQQQHHSMQHRYSATPSRHRSVVLQQQAAAKQPSALQALRK